MQPQFGTQNYVARYRKQFGRNADFTKPVTTIGGKQYNAAGDLIVSPPQSGPSGYETLTQQIADLTKRINQQAYAPALNYDQINAQARQQAAGAVNPRYVKELQLFQQQQQAKRQQQQQQYQLQIGELQRELQESLQASGIQRERTSEDVSQNIADIANQEDVFQTDAGQQFEESREALGQELASTGLGRSGIGAQQVAKTVEQQNTAEERQTQQFQQVREQQNLFKNRTFEDLLRSDELSKASKKAGEKAAKFELDSYLKNLDIETEMGKRGIEADRLSALRGAESDARSGLVQSFIQSITNPAQRQAAYQTYGALL